MNVVSIVSAALLLSLPLCSQVCGDDKHIAGIDIGNTYESRVREGIERNRKGDARVVVVDRSGAPVSDARVTIRQVSHDFLFGCAFPAWAEVPGNLGSEGWANWNKYFTRLFNYTTSENALKWTPLEPEEGKYRWEAGDFMVRWCRERGIKIKGHTLIWPYDPQGIPQWIRNYAPEQISTAAKKRIDTVIGHYRNDIRIWDVVNEPVHLPWYEQHWGKDYVVDSFKWARAADPGATLVINEYASFVRDGDKYVALVKDLLAKGAPIDAMGEQAHDPPHWYSPKEVFDTLDKMAATGLRVHLTELTYPSNGADITGGFVKGKWDEAMQGRFYRYFATLAFSHPNVDAITLWAMWDGSSWLKPGGIIREDWTPKPAYEALDDLINNKWKTHFATRSDTRGEVRFRGFLGGYEIQVVSPSGKTRIGKLHLAATGDNEVKFRID